MPATQKEVFDDTAKPVIEGLIDINRILIWKRYFKRLQRYHIRLWSDLFWKNAYYAGVYLNILKTFF